jgi:hypothetical protein
MMKRGGSMEQQQSGARIGRHAFGGILHDQGLIS